jgi:hypothetical protein
MPTARRQPAQPEADRQTPGLSRMMQQHSKSRRTYPTGSRRQQRPTRPTRPSPSTREQSAPYEHSVMPLRVDSPKLPMSGCPGYARASLRTPGRAYRLSQRSSSQRASPAPLPRPSRSAGGAARIGHRPRQLPRPSTRPGRWHHPRTHDRSMTRMTFPAPRGIPTSDPARCPWHHGGHTDIGERGQAGRPLPGQRAVSPAGPRWRATPWPRPRASGHPRRPSR